MAVSAALPNLHPFGFLCGIEADLDQRPYVLRAENSTPSRESCSASLGERTGGPVRVGAGSRGGMPNLDRDAGSVEEKKGLVVGDDDDGEEEEFYMGVSQRAERAMPPM